MSVLTRKVSFFLSNLTAVFTMFFNVSSTLELAYTYRSFTTQILHMYLKHLVKFKKKVLDISSFRKHTCADYQENVDVLEINYRDSEVLNVKIAWYRGRGRTIKSHI